MSREKEKNCHKAINKSLSLTASRRTGGGEDVARLGLRLGLGHPKRLGAV